MKYQFFKKYIFNRINCYLYVSVQVIFVLFLFYLLLTKQIKYMQGARFRQTPSHSFEPRSTTNPFILKHQLN